VLVRFWGTRGSLPTPLVAAAVRGKVRDALQAAIAHGLPAAGAIDRFIDERLGFEVAGTFGGNTACVEIDDAGEDYVICDLGTGLRELGNAFMRRPRPGKSKTFNVFLSHLHWDHIMGFPFFVPAYLPGHDIVVHSCHDDAETALRRQHRGPSFPVDFTRLGASISFRKLEPDRDYAIAGLKVRAMRQYHEGDSYGYRFEHAGKAVVYSTDSEHKGQDEPSEEAFARFFRDADLVIFDAMYSLAETVSLKEDWGHSSNILGVELAHRARAKRLALFHHEPTNDDAALQTLWRETVRFEELSRGDAPLEVISAYDGLEVRL
jgi:phosphoribosyl 1,2-cyclic phosphodiesterase